MKYNVKGVHYEVTDVTRDFLNVKMEKLQYASELFTDCAFTLYKDSQDSKIWCAEVKFSFKWGVHAHLEEKAFNLHEAIEKLVDKLDSKVAKEKEKVQDHHHEVPKAP